MADARVVINDDRVEVIVPVFTEEDAWAIFDEVCAENGEDADEIGVTFEQNANMMVAAARAIDPAELEASIPPWMRDAMDKAVTVACERVIAEWKER